LVYKSTYPLCIDLPNMQPEIKKIEIQHENPSPHGGPFKLNTHYSSPEKSPPCSFNESKNTPVQVSEERNEKNESLLSFGSKMADSGFKPPKRSEKIVKYLPPAKIPLNMLENSIHESKNKINEKDNELIEIEKLSKRKSELYGAFTERYILSPNTLGKFFDVAEMEAKYLKSIKKKADALKRNKSVQKFNKNQNKTVDIQNKNVECENYNKNLQKLSVVLAKLAEKLNSDQNEKIDLMNEKNLNKFIKSVENYIEKINEKEKEIENRKNYEITLEKRLFEIIKKENELKTKEQNLNIQIEDFSIKCKEFGQIQADFINEKSKFEQHKTKRLEILKNEEAKLRTDWEKLRILEQDLNKEKIQNQSKKIIRSESKDCKKIMLAPEICKKNTKLNTGSNIGNSGTKKRNLLRKSIDLYNGNIKNKENMTNNIENTNKFQNIS